MQTKLTIRVDDQLIERAKAYSRRTGKSVSQLVADYFAVIDIPIEEEADNLPPITRELSESLVGFEIGDIGEEDYHRHLMEKYG